MRDNNSTTTNASFDARSPRVGVADYFAILGVGEELVWKHAAQRLDDDSPPEEDDAMLLERFYRDIVDCQIVVACNEFSSGYNLNRMNSNSTPNNSTILWSPSDVTSVVSTAEMEGWNVQSQTRPASLDSATAPLHPQSLSSSSLWQKGQTWEANLDPLGGLAGEIQTLELEATKRDARKNSTPLKDLREKVQSTFQQRSLISSQRMQNKYFLSYRKRAPDESHLPAIADIAVHYVQLHKITLEAPSSLSSSLLSSPAMSRTPSSVERTISDISAAALLRVAEAGKHALENHVFSSPSPLKREASLRQDLKNRDDAAERLSLESFLSLPKGYDEWSIPKEFQKLHFPSRPPDQSKTRLFVAGDSNDDVEAVVESPVVDSKRWQEQIQPKIVGVEDIQTQGSVEQDEYMYIPILAIRRQRIGNDERFYEDPAIVDITVSFFDRRGDPVLPIEEVDAFEEEEEDFLEKMSDWTVSSISTSKNQTRTHVQSGSTQQKQQRLGTTCLLVKRNAPLGFCDAAFSTNVLDRFPYKNYKGLPLPEEELPMFCYPTGCRLHRAKFSDAPLPQYYGFVVKNERGDSINVSCVSFMEPLTNHKQEQLARLSAKRKRVSLPHARFWARRRLRKRRQGEDEEEEESIMSASISSPREWIKTEEGGSECDDDAESDFLLTGFDEMTTFENKTICLVSRYPYWTAFRRFLSHLHSVSGSSSDLPLERYISHLLLTVPIPKAGGPSILIPLPTFNEPMVLSSPPLKDLPVVDLPFERLVSCLDVPTIVTVVLGFLALERKVIVMSTRPSLVLDVCELLRSLLFPFDLCAPYVPRLTEPFMSCLDFPGAIFVGIHDDGTPDGLAAVVRKNMPEDSTIVDLDSGSVDCSGDRMTVVNTSWGIIPPGPRSVLVSEIETLCRDAGIVPGQEPLDSQLDPAFDASMPMALVEDEIPLGNTQREPLDDRAIRDAFLRFFCSVLAGYETFLVVPDVDFLISGNEWFDSKGFLASASEDRAAFLGMLVGTQLFQSFIQRRTEASDVQCLLFDECLSEFHSAPVPYGRLGGDVETIQTNESGQPQMLYSLLVDQSAAETQTIGMEPSFDADSRPGSDTDSSGHHMLKSFMSTSEVSDKFGRLSEDFAINTSGDWVTKPSRHGLPESARFIYCVDGNPTFPDRLNADSYFPRQPESWLVEMSTVPTPMLTRSAKEIEEAERRRKVATTYRGLTQRRCLWQLPKLMGSHFLGTWLLCVPTLVAQPHLSHDQQSRYLLRALGALRLLRSKQRIVPDEAAYRALIVACGRTKNDRRAELVKLFGLLRADGIFPSAVTLGQYTRALAEGYSKQSIGTPEEDPGGGVEVAESDGRDLLMEMGQKASMDAESCLSTLDGNIAKLEAAGHRWRQKNNQDKEKESGHAHDEPSASTDAREINPDRQRKKSSSKAWFPVVLSSSLVPSKQEDSGSPSSFSLKSDSVRLVAIWSRTKSCDSCGYIPLEEEVQAGWDVPNGENDIPGAICCPRCGALLIPQLGYKEMFVDEALSVAENPVKLLKARLDGTSTDIADFGRLPPQISPMVERTDASYVTYVSPASLRSSLERLIDEHGEAVLDRDSLKALDPELFYNLFWYCARFSLPLPLPISTAEDKDPKHYFLLGAWDYRIATRGCYSCAKVLCPFLDSDETIGAESFDSLETYGDYPLMGRFNLQSYYSTVWDSEDLSEILVTLVEACDRRDFKPVVECMLRCNKRRRDKYGGAISTASSSDAPSSYSFPMAQADGESSPMQSMELECYRTILYLAKYQCTTAFHAFFPATMKPCKGYHFWCPIAPLPIFDRMLREAVKRVRAKDNSFAPFYDVSDVALGFRCVFGHLM